MTEPPSRLRLSLTMRAALRAVAKAPLRRRRDGWAHDNDLVAFPSTTIFGLVHRGLAGIHRVGRGHADWATPTEAGLALARRLAGDSHFTRSHQRETRDGDDQDPQCHPAPAAGP